MGLCLSGKAAPYNDRRNEISANNQQQSADPPIPQNAWHGTGQHGPTASPTHGRWPEPLQRNCSDLRQPPLFQNRFLKKISEQKCLFSEEQQEAILRLEIFDERKHQGLKNKNVIPVDGALSVADKAARTTLKRTASFFLIKGILADMVEAGRKVILDDGPEKFLTQSLLTVQAEAIRHQVQIGKHEVLRKAHANERVSPFLMETEKFDRFLKTETRVLREIAQICRTDGHLRETRLMASLQSLAHNYLKLGRRLPPGTGPNQIATINDLDVSDEKIKILLSSDWDFGGASSSSVTVLCPSPDPLVAMIVIDPEDSTTSFDDPCEGSSDERFYALGFEGCEIAEKQAAVLIQKLFYELGWLELHMAYLNATKSTAFSSEASIAARSEADTNYIGSIELGDFCDAHDTDPPDHRRTIVDKVSMLNPLANAFPNLYDGRPLLLDPDLNHWVQGARFQTDLACLKHPERRAWIVNVELVKSALKRTPVFNAPARGVEHR